MSVPKRRFRIEDEEVLTQSRKAAKEERIQESLPRSARRTRREDSSRSGNREICVFRIVGLEKNLSLKDRIATAAVISSCSSGPSWLKRILLIWTGSTGLKKKNYLTPV